MRKIRQLDMMALMTYLFLLFSNVFAKTHGIWETREARIAEYLADQAPSRLNRGNYDDYPQTPTICVDGMQSDGITHWLFPRKDSVCARTGGFTAIEMDFDLIVNLAFLELERSGYDVRKLGVKHNQNEGRFYITWDVDDLKRGTKENSRKSGEGCGETCLMKRRLDFFIREPREFFRNYFRI